LNIIEEYLMMLQKLSSLLYITLLQLQPTKSLYAVYNLRFYLTMIEIVIPVISLSPGYEKLMGS